jgi:hypothetical protein
MQAMLPQVLRLRMVEAARTEVGGTELFLKSQTFLELQVFREVVFHRAMPT